MHTYIHNMCMHTIYMYVCIYISPIYMGILIQIHIQIGFVDSNPDSDRLTHVDCGPDSNPGSGPGAHVNRFIHAYVMYVRTNTCTNKRTHLSNQCGLVRV